MIHRLRAFAEKHTEVSIYLTIIAGMAVAGAGIFGGWSV